ncbi:MAG: N-acetylmuramoyl-L-alanine amidase [Lawsonibacter sp.]|nr:N-acetylmuramoyl-L-alanine amidase [Lawsonibacter sp.]
MLTGKTNEEKIWNYLTAAGLTACGAAGLMGNLHAESGLNPQNLQNTYEKKLGYTDATYTAAVDNGTYTGFDTDRAGYGLCQWTYHTRKAALLAFAKAAGKSVGDLETQLAFLVKELKSSFPAVMYVLRTAKTVWEASDMVLLDFERPADRSDENCERRASYGQKYFDKYAKKGSDSTMGFTNSSLATVKMISPNKTVNRNHVIDTITIHCFVGQVTAKRGCEVFQPSSKQASCNYVVGYDGSIGLCVEEKDRSWCTGGTMKVNGISGSSNDYQAVTIEVASNTTHPYAITDKAMAALIELCADICRRNGIKKLLWSGDKNLVGQPSKQNMTVHRWFANKACPGDYIYQRLGDIAAKVNAKLGATGAAPVQPSAPVSSVPYKVRITATDLRIRKGPGTNTAIVQNAITPGVYTIVSEATGKGATLWGKLKSGKGWVSLDFCKKI